MASVVKALKSGWFLTLLGVLLICLLIWFGGPYLGLGESKPLESPISRLVLILIVVLTWALIWHWKNWQAARANRNLGASVAGPDNSRAAREAGTGSSISGADAQLRQKFEEAFSALRKSATGASNLLELPWYIIIGPPGSGKTTVLANSGLNFPLADRFGKAAVRGVGGTRNCDWWFTTDAILLDTAGRYTTQESNQGADQAGWIEFLNLLKKRRRRRPINGVLLAFSLADIALLSDGQRENHVRAIRQRLEELYQYLGVRLPVYLLLTKADLVAGFNEYFDDFDKRACAQVWGVTFPWELSQSGKAPDRLAAEFDDLVARVSARVPERLQGERDAARRSAVFRFPQQLAGLKTPLTEFVRGIFASSALDDRLWLRGVYLTSGTQEGTPIDRMLGSLAKTFGLGVAPTAAAPGRGKAYFIEKLLREVIFREAGLAGSDRKAEIRSAILVAVAYLAIVAVTALFAIGMTVSYRSNATYLNTVASAAQPLQDEPRPGSSATLEQIVPSLDAISRVVAAAGAYRDHVPWSMRFALFQGERMWNNAEREYFAEMNSSLGPAAAHHFAQRIEMSGADPDKLYQYLKAYLMLADPQQRLNTEQMKLISHAEWSRALTKSPEAAERIAAHFDAYVEEPDRMMPATVDAGLVERARASLQQTSPAVLMYSRVRLSYAGDTEHSLHLDKELGVGADILLLRKSGKPLSEPLVGQFTRTVFDEFNSKGKLELVKTFLEDSWILGDKGLPLTQTPKLAADVVQLYERDYIKAWDQLLNDITIRQPRDTAEAVSILGSLSSPASPLKRLLVITEANTNLLKPAPAGSAEGAVTAKLAQTTGALDKVFGADTSVKPGTMVTQHFAALNEMVTGTPAPIDAVLTKMSQAQQQLQAASGLGGQPGSPAVLAAIQNALGALKADVSQAPPVVAGLVGGLTGQSQSVAEGNAHSDLEARYQTQVVSQCRELLGARYPFSRSSAGDVTLEDFARVFGAGGIFDAFFQANLIALVDNSRPQWRWKEGAAAIGGSTSMLAQFQAVEELRKVFFKPAGQTPEVRFLLTPDELAEGVDRFHLEIDGQVLDYGHGVQKATSMTWPGGPVGQIVARLEEPNGAHPQIAFQGPWALFRLLDHASIQPQSETRFLVTIPIGGKWAKVFLEAASIRNPFARREVAHFHCG